MSPKVTITTASLRGCFDVGRQAASTVRKSQSCATKIELAEGISLERHHRQTCTDARTRYSKLESC